MPKKNVTTVYEPRERQDSELERAIGEILSAEDEARRIIDRAEASVEAIRLDAAAREREMNERAVVSAAAEKAKAVKGAEARADAAVKKIQEDAETRGKALFDGCRTAMDKRISELFDMVRGK